MIGWLKGRLQDADQPGQVVLDVQGVGYLVEVSLATFFEIETHPAEVALLIHTIVREDAFLLYGFIDQQERALFRALIKVNGVGPKLAMTILSSISPDDFIQSIQDENTPMLVKLPGIGKKTAERLMVEMKDKVAQLPRTTNASRSRPSVANQQEEAISALESLGYKRQEASKVIAQFDHEKMSCEQLIRGALQRLVNV